MASSAIFEDKHLDALFADTVDHNPSEEGPNIVLLSPADVEDTLRTTAPVQTLILDPWYNKGVGGQREDYHSWLSNLISLAADVAQHIFVWGFPEILAHQVALLPKSLTMRAWLTWYYKNCPSVIRGWRPAQNACLHLTVEGARMYPENFLNAEQRARFESGKMRFIPSPPSVIEAALNTGFVKKCEQTGHPAQKPMSVIERLVLMSTKPGDVVLDPMCGSGTTGEVCYSFGRQAVLCDINPKWLQVTEKRLLARQHAK